jgi:REP element-mobilizing transposase RayT
MRFPQAYHITWGVYGGRLPGTDRPHVDHEHNGYGTPLAPANAAREEAARGRMRFDPVSLDEEQRLVVKRAIEEVTQRYAWKIHEIAVQADHVHVVITAPREGEALRDALKAVATKQLNKVFGAKVWWAEKGSAKYLYEDDYFENAKDYVRRQREF